LKKNVLQLIGSFHQGGSERQAVNLTRLLARDDKFTLFAATLNNEGVLRPEIEALGLSAIPEFPLTSFYNANFVRQVRRCAAYLRGQQIDLVHTHDFYTNVFGMAAATLAGIPARVASKRETAGMRTRAQEFVENIAFSRANRIVVNSSAVSDHLTARGLSAEKLAVIYNGISTKRFTQVTSHDGLREKLGLPTGVRLITLVANLRHTVKNVPMLLRTAKRVIAQQPEVHFVLAGEGDLESDLKQQARELGIADHVHFTGRCTEVPALLAESYACVLTSAAEGFSNSILEYMAAGKPVVATNVGGAAEAIIEGKTGYIVEPDDDEAMAGRLVELLADKGKAETLGAAGRMRTQENFSEAAQLSKTTDLYERLLDRN
jgi:glycosyltransferase involved in cell wall biosynthesis